MPPPYLTGRQKEIQAFLGRYDVSQENAIGILIDRLCRHFC